ncbi:unnamed protein product [Oppiella nova]|uniref:Uncharacterized protein n=1 Tax=Oppiella nova TaxID=334625 RepID=A0A7R9LRR0_9ACAR|nr:unnamed protein product [Oppiella nova]CAG2166307.1 unnamed protein product [Oppiella nova]
MDTLMNSNTITAADGLELTSLYESYMDVIRELLISLATKDKNDIERAHKTIDSHLRLCDKNRKTGLMLTVLSYVKTPNYHRYSDVESHSELLYAYGIIFYAMICFNQLNKVAFTSTNMQGQMCKMVLILFWTFVEAHFSLTAKNVDICQQLLNKSIDNKAKLAQISGNIDESINIHKKLITDYESDIFVKYFCIKYALLVRKGMTHSPAFTTYCEAVFRYLKGTDESDTRELERAVQLLGIVPSIRVRYFGKSLTVEKMAVMSAQKEARFGREYSIPPQSVMELGLVELELNNRAEAEKWLKKSLHDYSNYMNENYVHIRAYAALRELGVSSDKHSVDQIQCQEYRNQWLRDTRNDEENVDKIQANEKEINA